MLQRQVWFNVNELARRAVEAIGAGARTCVDIKKYPDGMYNNSILLTMDNGSQVVAKVPNPNAGMPHFTTASEVATMDFVCFLSGVIGSRYWLTYGRHGTSSGLLFPESWLGVPRQRIPSVQNILLWKRFHESN